MLSFALRRPWLLIRFLTTNRNRPDLEKLAAPTDPERFVWEILPHAARTFASCIVLLPAEAARAAAVAYLYCRMLDTYEDLLPDAEAREAALTELAHRLESVEEAGAPRPVPEFGSSSARDERDRTHLLLVSRADHVDRVYLGLPADVRGLVRDLVRDMGEGMCRFSRAFREQGGVLVSEDQVTSYCRAVIGHPVVFMMRLLRWRRTGRADLTPELFEAGMTVGELVQLANITRDVEKDLRRGVAYHPSLKDDLGRSADGDEALRERVRIARKSLLELALSRAPSYRHLVGMMDRPRVNLARASALLMLLYTDRHYRSCARRAGMRTWPGRATGLDLILGSLPAAWSRRWADRILKQVLADFRKATLSAS